MKKLILLILLMCMGAPQIGWARHEPEDLRTIVNEYHLDQLSMEWRRLEYVRSLPMRRGDEVLVLTELDRRYQFYGCLQTGPVVAIRRELDFFKWYWEYRVKLQCAVDQHAWFHEKEVKKTGATWALGRDE